MFAHVSLEDEGAGRTTRTHVLQALFNHVGRTKLIIAKLYYDRYRVSLSWQHISATTGYICPIMTGLIWRF